MNSTKLSQGDIEALSFPIIICPVCSAGSLELTFLTIGKSVWDKIQCISCRKHFEIAKAIDEMFINNRKGCYSTWSGGHQVSKQVICETGKNALVDIKGIFEEIYSIDHWFIGGASYFAGGLSKHFIPQGYIMVSVAQAPLNKEIDQINILLTVEGRTKQQPKLMPWQQMMLRAKLNLFSAPNLTVIMALNAVDLFIEQLTSLEIEIAKGKGRPDLWSYYIKQEFGITLRELVGKSDFLLVEKFVQTRNAIAHGGDYLKKLPQDILEKEEEWLANGNFREGSQNLSPCAQFALRCSLKIIRNCRRLMQNKMYIRPRRSD